MVLALAACEERVLTVVIEVGGESGAKDKGAELDISTTNPEAFGDFLGKMSAAVKARS